MAIFKANYLRRTAPDRGRPRLMQINIASLPAAVRLERLNKCASPRRRSPPPASASRCPSALSASSMGDSEWNDHLGIVFIV